MPEIGESYNVTDEIDGKPYGIPGLFYHLSEFPEMPEIKWHPAFRASCFIPLSDIDETELVEQREKEEMI